MPKTSQPSHPHTWGEGRTVPADLKGRPCRRPLPAHPARLQAQLYALVAPTITSDPNRDTGRPHARGPPGGLPPTPAIDLGVALTPVRPTPTPAWSTDSAWSLPASIAPAQAGRGGGTRPRPTRTRPRLWWSSTNKPCPRRHPRSRPPLPAHWGPSGTAPAKSPTRPTPAGPASSVGVPVSAARAVHRRRGDTGVPTEPANGRPGEPRHPRPSPTYGGSPDPHRG